MKTINRRDLLGGALTAGAALAATPLTASGAGIDKGSNDEDFWSDIALEYDLDDRYTVLNGGGNNPLPAAVVDAWCRYQRHAATQPRPFNYQLIAYREQHRRRLAPLFGCDSKNWR